MFTIAQRDHVRQSVLEMARVDPRVTAGALTGSTAFGDGDQWSDIDIAFGITEGVAPEVVLQDWTEILHQSFNLLAYFDLSAGPSIYRVFLLSGGLEVDIAVTPARAFGARGPNFHLLFGAASQAETSSPDTHFLIGSGWHHALHARICIDRHKPWQAEYWISELRNQILALICMRLGENSVHGRGLDHLPSSVTSPLAETLVRSLDETELRRAQSAAAHCLLSELQHWDAELCTRLQPLLQPSNPPDVVEQKENQARNA